MKPNKPATLNLTIHNMARIYILPVILICSFTNAKSAELLVPGEFASIQKAIDEAQPGDVVIVSAGTWFETITLKPKVTVKSAGDNTPGTEGLKRAEATILDGSKGANQSGVTMAEGSHLDGFTITNATHSLAQLAACLHHEPRKLPRT